MASIWFFFSTHMQWQLSSTLRHSSSNEVTHFQLTVLMWMPHCRSDQRSRQARNSNAFKLLVLLVILDNGPLILGEVFFT